MTPAVVSQLTTPPNAGPPKGPTKVPTETVPLRLQHLLEERAAQDDNYVVKVAHHKGAARMYVRSEAEERILCVMTSELAAHFGREPPKNVPLAALIGGTVCAVSSLSQIWQRAVVRRLSRGGLVTVRLLDTGGTVKVEQVQLFLLSGWLADLRTVPPLATRCHLFHLKALSEEGSRSRHLQHVLDEAEVLRLQKRGDAVVLASGEESLPVDLIVYLSCSVGPFQPTQQSGRSIAGLLNQQKLANSGEVHTETDHSQETAAGDCVHTATEDLETASEYNLRMKATGDVVEKTSIGHTMQEKETAAVNDKDTYGFQWLPPQFPSGRQFLARGTYVDAAGQVYVQQQSESGAMTALGKLLDTRLASSCPHQGTFRREQECSVRWKDGHWYRARFLRYFPDDPDIACVLLVDYGNVYLAHVREEVRAQVYARDYPMQALPVVLHDLVPEYGMWRQPFLDYLMENVDFNQPGLLLVEVVGDMDEVRLPLMVKISIVGTCHKCGQLGHVTCRHRSPLDLATLLSSLEDLGADKAGHLAALHHPRLKEAREDLSLIKAVMPAGSYPTSGLVSTAEAEANTSTSLQTTPPTSLCPLEKRKAMSSSHMLAVAEIVSVTAFNKVTVQLKASLEDWSDNIPRQEVCGCGKLSQEVCAHRLWSNVVSGTREGACVLEVELCVEAVDSDEELLRDLMTECVLSWEDSCWVQVQQVRSCGQVTGHLVSREGLVLYRGLVREGLVRLSTAE